jgi:crotonobetainyl-CoA:carnitine CoA-transferase CaiB-like acyl-CoA transferase
VLPDLHRQALGAVSRSSRQSELLRTDARFKNIRTRTQAIDSLYQLVADELPSAPRPSGALLPQEEIPIFPMHSFESLLEDGHLAETGFFEHRASRRGPHPGPAVPSEWSGTPPQARHLAPALASTRNRYWPRQAAAADIKELIAAQTRK